MPQEEKQKRTHKLDEERVRELRAHLRQAPYGSLDAIAAQFGITVQAVSYHRRRIGLPAYPPKEKRTFFKKILPPIFKVVHDAHPEMREQKAQRAREMGRKKKFRKVIGVKQRIHGATLTPQQKKELTAKLASKSFDRLELMRRARAGDEEAKKILLDEFNLRFIDPKDYTPPKNGRSAK